MSHLKLLSTTADKPERKVNVSKMKKGSRWYNIYVFNAAGASSSLSDGNGKAFSDKDEALGTLYNILKDGNSQWTHGYVAECTEIVRMTTRS